jgi:hypothetical protein
MMNHNDGLEKAVIGKGVAVTNAGSGSPAIKDTRGYSLASSDLR